MDIRIIQQGFAQKPVSSAPPHPQKTPRFPWSKDGGEGVLSKAWLLGPQRAITRGWASKLRFFPRNRPHLAISLNGALWGDEPQTCLFSGAWLTGCQFPEWRAGASG